MMNVVELISTVGVATVTGVSGWVVARVQGKTKLKGAAVVAQSKVDEAVAMLKVAQCNLESEKAKANSARLEAEAAERSAMLPPLFRRIGSLEGRLDDRDAIVADLRTDVDECERKHAESLVAHNACKEDLREVRELVEHIDGDIAKRVKRAVHQSLTPIPQKLSDD